MKRVYVDHMDFRELLPYYDGLKSDGGTVFFLDPPYYVDDPAYVHWFMEKDHTDLAAAVRKLNGRWLMTINDCPEYREWYAGSYFHEKPKQYGIAGRREFSELIISNYPLPTVQQASLI
jgi:DNA adenine methylase